MQLALLLISASFTVLVSGQGWTQIPRGLTHVSSNLNYIWGVDSNDDIFMCQRPCTGGWRQIAGKLVQVDVDDHQVWGVNANGNIYTRPVDGSGSSWRQIAGGLIHVSASGNGYVWGTNRGNNIYKCKKPCTGGWILVGGGLKQIDGGQREVCGVNRNNSTYCRPVDGSGSWRHVPRNMKCVTTSSLYDLYGIGVDDRMYRCRKPCIGQWIEVSHESQLVQCDGTADALFGVDQSNSIWRKDLPL